MSDRSKDSLWLARSRQKAAWDEAYQQSHPRWRGPSDLQLSALHGRVLELGCGDGKTAIGLVEKNLDVIGLDQSRTALSILRDRAKDDGLRLVQADALALPFTEGSFDAVTAVHLIDHLLSDDRSKATVEINRVLRPGGMVVGRFFSIDDMRFGKGEEIESDTYLRGNGVFTHYFTEEEILALFPGYRVLSIVRSMRPTKFPTDSGNRSLITAELVRP